MESFARAYRGLNKSQREAVDTIDGPVLVIAGPGTGKTQLISTRVGKILKSTDTLPQNILLLTFTEAGVTAMRERLAAMLGQAAYEVNISTYHAFGSEIIRRYPEYFEVGLEPIDDLESFTILRSIITRLPYSNPMKYADAQLGDILNFISDAKRALLQPNHIDAIAKHNLKQIRELNKESRSILANLGIISKKSLPIFMRLLLLLEKHTDTSAAMPDSVLPLANYAATSLREAIAEAEISAKTTPLTLWKNSWLAKDQKGKFIFSGEAQNQKLSAASGVYRQYQANLARRKFYDYDDMILRAIQTLEEYPELKYSLAEQYLYIMLDEFQDTNPAQMRLIELLTDHPVLEGRPNVLAVGDDDQAIYAFQGAVHANMAEFARHYKDVKIISLRENYRSTPEILYTAKNIAAQISDRLHAHFAGMQKDIVPAAPEARAKALELRQFRSDAAQYEWVAKQISRLNKEGVALADVAILAPRHRNLQPLLAYLAQQKLAVRYERRDNILDAPLVRQLEQMSRLTLALAAKDIGLADTIWPEVLSYDFWGLGTEDIWQLSWRVERIKSDWTQILLKDSKTKTIVLFFLRLKDLLGITTLEQQLDILVGAPETSQRLEIPVTSPFFEYYFGAKAQTEGVDFIELLGQLSTLRRHLNERRRMEDKPLTLADFIGFIDEYRAAGLNVLDTNAYREAEDAVNVMTAYAAKGREFAAVFVIDAQDEVWGSASRTRGQYLSLPANLIFIRYRGASEDERLRLLYVAATRAKSRLYITSYSRTLAGKTTTRLKYLDIREEDSGALRSEVLPKGNNLVIQDSAEGVGLEAAQNYWSSRHSPPFKPTLKRLLGDKLGSYQLSATHLNHFLDVTRGGPQAYLLYCLLAFPTADSAASHYGSAVHETIWWIYQISGRQGRIPTLEAVLNYFSQRLEGQKMAKLDHDLFLQRGQGALTAWFGARGGSYSKEDKYEFNFRREASFVGQAHLTGKVDRLIVNRKKRTITVVDFKTGQPYRRWVANNVRLFKYRQQLLFYKVLVENSRSFRGYTVDKGLIEFIEPDEYGQIVQLELLYEDSQVEAFKKLLDQVWRHIKELKLPNIDKYPPTITGIREFEKDLLA